MLTIALIASAAYVVRTMVFAIGARRAAHPARVTGTMPIVSVIIAARDEEENIVRCLDSIAAQEYPRDRFEVLVMNDGSTDRTAELVRRFELQHLNIRCLEVHDEDSHLRGKARAVAQGIDVARGELFATTDADCRVGPHWLATAVSYFEPVTGLVAGFTLQEPRGLFGAVQALDWAFLLTLASAGFGLRRPLGCIGNNLFFRREAYALVGGYRGFKFSITEDFALLQAVERTGKWEYKYPVDADMLVWSEPCPDLMTLLRQKRRWALGGRGLRLRGYMMLISSVMIDAAIVASLVTCSWLPLGLTLAVRWGTDLILIQPSVSQLGVGAMLRFFPLYELYALTYELVIPFGMMKQKVEWKGRTF